MKKKLVIKRFKDYKWATFEECEEEE